MAKNYSEIYSAVYTDGNKMNFGNSMIRGNGVPLDITEVYGSLEAAVRYAATNAIAYEGQLLAVTENGDTTVYVITPALQGTYVANPDGEGVGEEIPNYLKKVGTAPVGDGATVTVGEDGKVALVLTGATNSGTYVPKLENGKLVWEIPSATTVEGLDARLDTAEGEIDTLQENQAEILERLGEAEATVAQHTEAISDEEKAREEADDAILKLIGDAAKPESSEGADDGAAATGLYKTIEDAVAAGVQAAKEYADANDADTVYNDAEVRDLITQLDVKVTKNIEDIGKNTDAIAQEVEDRETAITQLDTDLKAYIGQQIGLQQHFSAQVVTDKSAMTDPTVLYLFKPEGAEGTDVYEQYIVINDVATLIGETSVDLDDYSTTSEVETAISTAITTSEEATGKLIDAVDKKADKNATDLSEFMTTVEDTYATKTDVSDLTEVVNGKADNSTVNELSGTVSDIAATVDNQGDEITALKNTDNDHNTRIKNLEDVGAEKNIVNSVTSEFSITNRELAIASVSKDKVAGLTADLTQINDDIASKVSKQTSKVTNTETGEEEDVEWILLSPENQAKLGALTVGDTGNIEISGKVNAENVIGLDSYITSKRNSIAGLLSETDKSKLDGIAAGAQANVIEGFSIAGSTVTPVSKIVDLPIATQTKLGVVLSSDAENKVSVELDGTMEVNSINVNKLVQTDGDVLILNGGSSL